MCNTETGGQREGGRKSIRADRKGESREAYKEDHANRGERRMKNTFSTPGMGHVVLTLYLFPRRNPSTGHAMHLDFRVWDLGRANEASTSQALIRCLGDGGQAIVGPGTSDGASEALPLARAYGAASSPTYQPQLPRRVPSHTTVAAGWPPILYACKSARRACFASPAAG